MSPTRLPANDGRVWPQVGSVTGADVRTGFYVGRGRILTAAHKLCVGERVAFRTSNGVALTGVVRALYRRGDTAVLRFREPSPPEISTGLPLGFIPDDFSFPIPYVTWGYQNGNLRQGLGLILARLPDGGLQLQTLNQLPGMSGAPIAFMSERSCPVAVGIAVAREIPAYFFDHQQMAYAYEFDRLFRKLGTGSPIICRADRRLAELSALALKEERRCLDAMQRLTFGSVVLLVFTVLNVIAIVFAPSHNMVWLPLSLMGLGLLSVAVWYMRELSAAITEARSLQAVCNVAAPEEVAAVVADLLGRFQSIRLLRSVSVWFAGHVQ